MKFAKFLMATAIFAASTCAFAQFANTSSSKGSSTADYDDYNRIKVSFVSAKLDYDYSGFKSSDIYEPKGVNVGLLHGTSILDMPLFLEYGLDATFLSSKESEDYVEMSSKYLYIAVPFNLAYRIGITDAVSLQPFAGINFRGNLMGKDKYEYDGESEKGDWFDDDYMGKDGVCNRFQMGYQFGVNVNFSDFYVGWQYQGDFMELAKKLKTKSNFISIGVYF